MRSARGVTGRLSRTATVGARVLGLIACVALPLRAQGGVLVQGIADAELWRTDTLSNLLTRNAGAPTGVGRLVLWGAVEPWRRVMLFAQGEFEWEAADAGGSPYKTTLEQFGIRFARSPGFVVDLGKMPSVVGAFASRRFSTRNPLIGTPDGYSDSYPTGAMVSGANEHFDYRAAAMSLPVAHEGYTPTPSATYRPAVGFGFTPTMGMRLGASATWGPYLNSQVPASSLVGEGWRHYGQRVLAADAEMSRGYLEMHAEYARGSYDVPTLANAVVGETYYIEAKYTLSPRLFVAARGERNNYPFVAEFGPSSWVGGLTDFHDGEAGVGYRLTASTLVKVSYRADKWVVTPSNRAFIRPGGRAFAMQLSQAFDVMDWFDRP